MPNALRLGVAYDFRNPPESGMSHQGLYAAIMDQVAWLDGLGLDLVWFTEHHFVEDGYLPSWIPVASAMAARTKHVRFSCDVCLLPFNHPLRLAEDLAVLDNISGGRVEIGVGMGYAPHEFRGFGLPVSRRGFLTDEGIAVLRRAFPGEAFSVEGITEEQRIPQTWVVGNVDHCVAELTSFIEEYGLTDIVSWAVPPGMRPDEMSPSLERYARDVAPRLRARFGGSVAA